MLLERSELLDPLLRRLHPHVYVKGSDYLGKPLGMTALLQELGIVYEIDPCQVMEPPRTFANSCHNWYTQPIG
jgi:hypothetical protein